MDDYGINMIRVDLLGVYERIKRTTSLRAKGLPDIHDEVMVTENHYRFINPLIINALSELADDVGVIELAEDLPLTRLSASLMRDGFMEMISSDGSEEEPKGYSDFIVHYRLPMNKKSKYRIGAVADLVYNAIVAYVLTRWYQGLGLYDDMQINERDYGRLVLKIRNHSYRFKNKNFSKPYISL